MFVGEYRHNVDTKGRLAIPFRMRSALERGAIVTRGVDTCLTVYTREEWDALAAKIGLNRPYVKRSVSGPSRSFVSVPENPIA